MQFTRLFAFLALAAPASLHAQSVTCPGTEPAIVIPVLEGWHSDITAGRRIGSCVVLEVNGRNFDSSPALIYPTYAELNTPKLPNHTVNLPAFINLDVADFRRKAAFVQVRAQPDIKTDLGDTFVVLDFLNGPAPNEFEEVAYLPFGGAVFMITLSARNQSDLNEYIAVFRRTLMHVAFKKHVGDAP